MAVGAGAFKFSLSLHTCLLNLFKRQPPGQYSGKQFSRKSGEKEIGDLGPAHCLLSLLLLSL